MSELLDRQLYSLLSRLHETRDESCRQLRQQAEAQAQELLVRARQRARRRVAEAVKQKRQRVAEHCRRVRVTLETRQRRRLFTVAAERLGDGVAALPEALTGRWQDARQRHAWCLHVLHDAGRVLLPGSWALLVAPGLSESERSELCATAADLAGGPVSLEQRDDVQAGLIVLHEGARVDGSVAGLLADRSAVEAALLAELATPEQTV